MSQETFPSKACFIRIDRLENRSNDATDMLIALVSPHCVSKLDISRHLLKKISSMYENVNSSLVEKFSKLGVLADLKRNLSLSYYE